MDTNTSHSPLSTTQNDLSPVSPYPKEFKFVENTHIKKRVSNLRNDGFAALDSAGLER